MFKQLISRYIILYLLIWTSLVFIMFMLERRMVLEDILYIELPGAFYKERVQDHIEGNLKAHIIIWLVGSSIIVLFNMNFLKLVKRTLFVEKKLRYSLDIFKTVFDNAKDHMYVLEVKENKQFFIFDVNKSALNELGYNLEELTGQPVEMIIDIASEKSREVRLKRIMNGEQITFELVKIRKDGTKFPVESSARLVAIGENEYIHSVERNIENRKLQEEQLIKAKLKAEENDRLKTAFLANMSHEIRTPMNGILGFTELLQNNNISEAKRSEYIEMINMSGNHLINLINDIIDISKLEAGKMSVVKRRFKLNPFLRTIVCFFQPLLKDNVQLTLETGFNDDDDILYTDDTRLKQILTNLIGNSLKFTQEGFVHISYSVTKEKMIVFKVQDTGIGMTKEETAIVFRRFRQADEETTRNFGGTGLGLAISRACVRLLGGKIWVESEKGKGSSFYFSLPYETDNSELQEAKNILNNRQL